MWYNQNREHSALDYQYPDEVYHASKKAAIHRSQREKNRRRYLRYLEPFAHGAYVEVFLEPDENRGTERLRLKRAAEALGLTLVFNRRKGRMLFEVKPENG